MSYFSQANTTYIDACLGVSLSSWEVANSFFTRTSRACPPALQAAFAAGNAAAAVALMSADAIHEDVAAHTRVRGQLQAQRYFTRALGQLPYGLGAALVHAEGSSQGGGYEWSDRLRRGSATVLIRQQPPVT
jgi:hypothetical protein